MRVGDPSPPTALRRARLLRGLTLQEVSSRLGTVSMTALSLAERGHFPLPEEDLGRLASFYGTHPEELRESA